MLMTDNKPKSHRNIGLLWNMEMRSNNKCIIFLILVVHVRFDMKNFEQEGKRWMQKFIEKWSHFMKLLMMYAKITRPLHNIKWSWYEIWLVSTTMRPFSAHIHIAFTSSALPGIKSEHKLAWNDVTYFGILFFSLSYYYSCWKLISRKIFCSETIWDSYDDRRHQLHANWYKL